MTLMHTIVYRSRYHRAPVTVLTGCKTKRLGRVKDSFNKISSEKQMRLWRVLDSYFPPPMVGRNKGGSNLQIFNNTKD